TLAARRYADDVPPSLKQARLEAVIQLAQRLSLESNQSQIGTTQRVLLEKPSRRSPNDLTGRAFSGRAVVVRGAAHGFQPGDFVDVHIEEATSATLIGYAKSPTT
ncbi:MAG: TRAM domain-containing protein, partial [Bacteroidia bacterium]|nr:TRAM domain-containing protein [Bacteroidia bacterium]MDW8135059.1 TRAM domain-containing protein [Bacteroidia bacterium]